MISLIQVVTHGAVDVAGKTIGSIEQGIVALIGMEKTDTEETARKLFDRILNYRIFKDTDGKTNLSLRNIGGGLLLVPQFTLVADTKKGLRPGFSKGMGGEEGRKLFSYLVSFAKENYSKVECGEFGAYMLVTLCNDGPMTFILTESSAAT